MKKKKITSVVSICDSIMDYYEDMAEEGTIQVSEVLKKIDLLVDNRYAIKVSGQDDTYGFRFTKVNKVNVACEFICKYNPKNEKYLVDTTEVRKNRYIDDSPEVSKLMECLLENGVYFAVLEKDNYAVLEISSPNPEDNDVIGYTIYFVGKNMTKWKNKFFDKYKEYDELNGKVRTQRIISEEGPKTARFKPFDKIVMREKEKYIRYIDNWLENIPKYYEYGTPKLSIMLYGEPGTGKTTFCKAVADRLGIDNVMCLSPNYFTGDEERGPRRRRAVWDAVIAIDDIDCVCKSREEDPSEENLQTMSRLLAYLDNPDEFYYKAKDGIFYPISIVIATTNYYDKLDYAVKRYGRFDLKIEMFEFNKKEAEEMCAVYGLKLKDVIKDETIDKNFVISPSKLQALCLENIDKSLKSID